MQLRLGPTVIGSGRHVSNCCGYFKAHCKEGMTPNGVDKLCMFNVAPFVMIIAMVIMAPLIFAKGFTDLGY